MKKERLHNLILSGKTLTEIWIATSANLIPASAFSLYMASLATDLPVML